MKVSATIGSIPISYDVIYRRVDGTLYSRRSRSMHVRIEEDAEIPDFFVDVVNSEETFVPTEVVEAMCLRSK